MSLRDLNQLINFNRIKYRSIKNRYLEWHFWVKYPFLVEFLFRGESRHCKRSRMFVFLRIYCGYIAVCCRLLLKLMASDMEN